MRALIVDDEVRVRKAVRLLVDWESHGIRDIEEAGGGNEAIDFIKATPPQLIIMDMMMESGHGLELMTWVREHAGNVKFIVVSGHDDFEFVRSTVRHGGIDYILKPIDPEAINAAVAKAVSQWREEEQGRLDMQHKSIRLNEFKPVYGEKLLSSLIDDPGSAEASLRRLREEGVIPADITSARLLLCQIDAGDAILQQRFGYNSELLHFALINICNEFLLPGRMGIAFRHWGAPLEILLLLWERPEQAFEQVEQINRGLHHTLQRRLHFGLGQTGSLPASLHRQYSEALAVLRRRNLLEPDRFIHTEVPEAPATASGKLSLSFAKVQEDWKLAVMSSDPAQMTAAAERWIDELCRSGKVTPELLAIWRNDILSFQTRLVREAFGEQAEAMLKGGSLDESDTPAPAGLANVLPNPDSYTFSRYVWRDWSLQVIEQTAKLLSRQPAKEKHTMADIVQYVEQHYQADLSLQEIAAQFYVSREYVSRKFKQEFGINFSDYLSQYRIDKAKLLMANPNLKLHEIGEMVGFRDVKYFSKVFKKLTGESPRDFRGR
ncbi:response regulator transcription factor [Paenibacillus senegalimassiliensis]|uniref:response regulator transcription factor n=1 Tax=Paenibacillus senegalimassiliensis TaxID=1737426 RepID=UPI00073F08FF|nr:helix-turn-helix domain-containing protein [Paenibacillus senegalimassiliensis]